MYNIHAPTFRLRLQIFKLTKQIAFDGEMRVVGLRQRREGEVLARVLARPLLDDERWSQWCTTTPSGSRVRKAALPVRAARVVDAAIVRKWKRAKDASHTTTKTLLKRTVFTRLRRRHLWNAHRTKAAEKPKGLVNAQHE